MFFKKKRQFFAKKLKKYIRLFIFLTFVFLMSLKSDISLSIYPISKIKIFNPLAYLKMTPIYTALIVLLLIGVLTLAIRIKRLMRTQQTQFKNNSIFESLLPSIDRNEYIILNNDYRRGNPKENYYRKTFSLRMLEVFGNCCAKCGSNDNGLDIDHFLFSKNEGGCFIMRHKDNYLINNAIPLCQSCNRSKSDKNFTTFFSEQELIFVLEKNMKLTKLINQESSFNLEGKILSKNRFY